MNAPLLIIGVALLALPFLARSKSAAPASTFDPEGMTRQSEGAYEGTRGQSTTPGGDVARSQPSPTLVHYTVEGQDFRSINSAAPAPVRSTTPQDSATVTRTERVPTPIASVPTMQQNPENDRTLILRRAGMLF